MLSNKHIITYINTLKSNINNKNVIIILSITLIISLIYMTFTLYNNESKYMINSPSNNITESFSNKKKREGKLKIKAEYSSKKQKDKLKKLKNKKKDPFDTDIDFSHYGTTEFKKQLPKSKSSKLLKLKLQNNPEYKNTKPRAIDEDDITTSNNIPTKTKTSNKKSNKTKEDFNDTFTLLKEIDSEANPGKYDRFQNILDEVDKIDTNSFSFTSMNDALRAYNDNINNRMKYAKKQSTSNFDGTMAQGSILIDELKKLFSYDSYF